VRKPRYLNYRQVSSDPALVAKADALANQYRDKKQQLRKNERDFEGAFNVILTNIEVYQSYDGWDLYIPTNNNLFTGKHKRNATYTTEILDALRWLIEEGYLEQVSGRSRPKKKDSDDRHWLPNAYRLSPKWLTDIASAPLSDPRLIQRNPLADYWELREDRYDNKGKMHKVAITPTVEQLETNAEVLDATTKTLTAYDNLMSRIDTSIGSSTIHPAQLSLTRVFSKGSFDLGGRLYAPIQNYTKETRKYYYFDSEPTIEIDYSSIHPHMLYHKEGLQFDGGDPYALEGFDRDAVKVAFNIMLNREAPKPAAGTISKVVGCDTSTAEALEEAIQDLHSPIAHHFNTGVGLRLQRTDSDLALQVINSFVNVLKRPIICVHDSFIVSVRDTESLILAMNDNYKSIHKDEQGMRGIKGVSLEFSDALATAIEQCFEQQTEALTDRQWDALIAVEGIQEYNELGTDEETLEL